MMDNDQEGTGWKDWGDAVKFAAAGI